MINSKTIKPDTMKQLIIILMSALFIASCTPERIEENEPPPSWIGTYNAPNGDTTFVSENGTYAKLEWGPKNNTGRFIFDSVMVHSNLTFTDNESITVKLFTPPYQEVVTSVGSGTFETNSMQFTFIIDGGGTISFTGVKSN